MWHLRLFKHIYFSSWIHCGVKIGSFFSLYFPLLSTNKGKYGPEKAPYLDTFHAALHFTEIKE